MHTTWIELGPDYTRCMINNIQFTVNHWLLHVRLGAILLSAECLCLCT